MYDEQIDHVAESVYGCLYVVGAFIFILGVVCLGMVFYFACIAPSLWMWPSLIFGIILLVVATDILNSNAIPRRPR